MIKKLIPALLAIILLTASIVYAREPKTNENNATNDERAHAEVVKPEEMRGVWVTFMTLDVENEANKESAFKAKVDRIIDEMAADNLNTMIVHTRPFCDAIYRSNLYPMSHILTGKQGQDPGYDPLEYIIEHAHKKKIAVHAWINPYRISTASTPDKLSADNPYVKDPSLGVEVDGELYLDPASDKARELIVEGAREIVKSYDVDGIHFDDYFYPPFCGDFDKANYEAYCSSTASPLSLEEFRKENVSKMVRETYKAIHDERKDVVFGISPQGNLDNNAALYADVAKWCSENGYIDYICPQLYYSIDNPDLTFENALDDWIKMKKHNGLELYVGLPVYKAGTDSDSGTWLDNSDILTTELKISRDKNTDGFMLYSYDSLHSKEGAAEIENMLGYLKENDY